MKKIFLFACMATAISSAAQVSNKISFQKGQKLEMETVVNSEVSSAMGGTTIKATINRKFDVEDVNNGSATIEHKVKRLQASFESAMGSQTFDSDKEKDMKNEIGQGMGKMLKNKYSMTLDETGNVLAVKSDKDSTKKAEDPGADIMSGMMGSILEGIEAPAVGSKTEFKILPDRSVNKGESWSDSNAVGKTVYTLLDVTDKDIVVGFVQDASIEKKMQFGPNEMTMTSKDKTKGRITLDKSSGLLRESSSTTDSEGTMEIMGQSLPLTTKTTKTVVVKPGS